MAPPPPTPLDGVAAHDFGDARRLHARQQRAGTELHPAAVRFRVVLWHRHTSSTRPKSAVLENVFAEHQARLLPGTRGGGTARRVTLCHGGRGNRDQQRENQPVRFS